MNNLELGVMFAIMGLCYLIGARMRNLGNGLHEIFHMVVDIHHEMGLCNCEEHEKSIEEKHTPTVRSPFKTWDEEG